MYRALLIMLVAMSCIPIGDAAGKILTTQHGVPGGYVVWTRFALGALFVLPFTWRGALEVWRDWRVWARSALIACGIGSITQALKFAPIADVYGAFFIAPLVSFVLSVWLLKEQARAIQAVLILTGFAGVLLVVRPGMNAGAGLGWAMLAGTFYGTFLTSSRWLSQDVSLRGLMATQMLGALALSTPFAFAFGEFPQITREIGLFTLASALFSMMGNMLLLFAYQIEDASKLAPFVYFQMIAATLLGWWLFADLPDLVSITGMALIIASGSAVAVITARRPIAKSS